MKKIVIWVAVILVVLIGAAVAVPFFVPADMYVQKLSDAVREATGRDLTIGKDVRFALFPRLELEAGDIAFSNAEGGTAESMVSLDSLQVQLKIMPLLSGQVEVDKFVLVKPVINLEVDKQGRANWSFGTGEAASTKDGGASGGVGLAGLRLGDIRLVDAKITYSDAKSGANETVDGVNMTVSLPDMDSPLNAEGALTWHQQPINLNLNLAKPNAFLGGKPSAVTALVSAKPVKLDFKGDVANPGPIKLSGTLALDVPSIRELAAWAGSPIEAPGDGLGPLSIKGKVSVDGPKVAFDDAAINIDAIKAKGGLSVDGSGAKPAVKGTLDVEALDLNPYLPPESESAPAKTAAAPADSGPGEWSDAPIDFSGLKAANADFKLTVGSILARAIKIGKGVVVVKLKDGKLAADLAELNLYDGKADGRVVVDASGKVPSLEKRFKLAGVQAQPFLKDATAFDRLTGTAGAEFTLSARGVSEKAMIETLNGNGNVKFENGSILGINLAAMVRNVSTAFLDSSAKEEQKTDFAELGGTFTITNGLFKNDDLFLKSPLLRVAGKGTSDLPKRTVDYRIEPKFAATLEGQGGEAKASGVTVPVLITGPWHDLSYKPDLAGMVKGAVGDPAKAAETIKKLVPSKTAPATGTSGSGTTNPLGAVQGLFGSKK